MKYEYELETIKSTTNGKVHLTVHRCRGGKIIHHTQQHSRKQTPMNTYRNFIAYVRAGGKIKGLDD